jgi:dipeptidase E
VQGLSSVPDTELLLLSNSRTANGWLVDHVPAIREIAGGRRRAFFVPYAVVGTPWPKMQEMLQAVLKDFSFVSLEEAELIIVSGGNTFQLLKEVRTRGLLEAISRRVSSGIPYIGWSAGANLACPTIKTTNDMPIVDPGGLDALGLVPFQINPHYTNAHPPGHQGETRDQRLAEFAQVNPDLPVVGLPEGDWLRVSGGALELRGPHPAVLFSGTAAPAALRPGPLRLP